MLNVVVFGFGNRAQKYVSCLDADCRVLAVVEPDPAHRAFAIECCHPDHCFASPQEFFDSGLEPDAVMVASPDNTHYDIASRCIERGWPMLLEKPVATTVGQCRDLAARSREKGTPVSVCYELHRYPLYAKLKEIALEGSLGKLLSIKHSVDVGIDRYTHSYVRGYWAKAEDCGPITLTKLCHDVDLFIWMLGQAPDSWTSSGSLSLFNKKNRPEGAAERCTACPLEKSCAYSAVDLYLRRLCWTRNFVTGQGESEREMVERMLATTNYGKCVFACDNDVNDTQTVNMNFPDGTRVQIDMFCGSRDGFRKTLMQFEKGTLEADGENIKLNGEPICSFPGIESEPLHAGADKTLVADFLDSVRGGDIFPSSLEYALSSHLVCLISQSPEGTPQAPDKP